MSQRALQFTRVDVTQVGQLGRRCLRVLPPSESAGGQQRIVVGDESGSVSCVGLRKGDLDQRFRTLPDKSGPVTRVELGSSGKPGALRERVYYAVGHSVVGVTKAGKEFLRFETCLTEPIANLHAEGAHLYASGDYSFYHFEGSDDKDFFLCHDRINDFFCCHITSDSELDAVLGCHDKLIRLLQGAEVLFEIPTDGSVTAVHRYDPESSRRTSDRVVIYGTASGTIGCVVINNAGFQQKWTVKGSNSPVNCITSADFSSDGCRDIAIGRDDGSVEVYAFEDRSSSSGTEAAPTLRFSVSMGESIQAIDHGQVVSPKFEDIVIGTFSGKIVIYSPDASNTPFSLRGGKSEEEAKVHAELTSGEEEMKRKIRAAEAEVKALEQKLQSTKEAATRLTEQPTGSKDEAEGESQPQAPAVVIPQIQVNFQLALIPAEVCSRLTLETKSPIEYVAVRSDVAVTVEEYDKESCNIATTPVPVGTPGCAYLATCKVSGKDKQRMELRVLTVEGMQGTLDVYVSPTSMPRTAQLVHIPIKPLSLHERVGALTQEELKRPFSDVKIEGSFTLAEIHAWMCLCFPEIPEKLVVESAIFNFRSALTGSYVSAEYRKGTARFMSDSLPSLSFLREFVTKVATSRQVKVHASTSVNDSSIPHMLELIHKRVDEHFQHQQRFLLVAPVQELLSHEQDIGGVLTPDLATIAAQSDEIRSEHDQRQRTLELLFGTIVDLFRARSTLRGKPVQQNKEAELRTLLSAYNADSIASFFQQL